MKSSAKGLVHVAAAKDQQGGRGCGLEFAIQNGSSDAWLVSKLGEIFEASKMKMKGW